MLQHPVAQIPLDAADATPDRYVACNGLCALVALGCWLGESTQDAASNLQRLPGLRLHYPQRR